MTHSLPDQPSRGQFEGQGVWPDLCPDHDIPTYRTLTDHQLEVCTSTAHTHIHRERERGRRRGIER